MEHNYQTLLIELNNDICLLTINRPSALNALNKQVFSELHHFFQSFAPGHPKLKGIILKGAGEKTFVAGADITEFKSIGPGQAKEFLKKGNEVMHLMMSFPKIVVACISGFALGGGCELAMACHVRIASEKARFGLPEVNLGILPGYGGTQRLPQLVGKAKALEWMMTGDMVSAADALRFGLVNQVVPHGEELKVALEWVSRISAKAPLSIARIIAAVNSFYPDLENGISIEGDHFNDLSQTEDFKEGVEAFLEKRKPEFRGE